jgi:hypothetical protein
VTTSRFLQPYFSDETAEVLHRQPDGNPPARGVRLCWHPGDAVTIANFSDPLVPDEFDCLGNEGTNCLLVADLSQVSRFDEEYFAKDHDGSTDQSALQRRGQIRCGLPLH